MKDVGNYSKRYVADYSLDGVTKIFTIMQTLSTVSGIANYFGKSNYGTFQLDTQRKKDNVSRGIRDNSDTRFSSSYLQVVSVHDCMNSIMKCVSSGVLKFNTAAVSYSDHVYRMT